MAFQTVPNTMEMRVRYDRSGDFSMFNIFHIRNTVTAWTGLHLGTYVDGWITYWNLNLKPLICADYTLAQVLATDIGTENGNQVERTPGTAGTRAGPAAAGNTACEVLIRCDSGALPKRGMVYQGGMADADLSTGAFENAYLVALEAAYEAMRSLTPQPGDAWVVVSRFSGSSLVSQPNGEVLRKPTRRVTGITNTIANVRCKVQLSTQDRRRGKSRTYVG